mgnify:CR=1 FL=1
MFELHSQLQQDCIELGDFPLSRLLLCNDANYPWFILVPRCDDHIREIYQLREEEQTQLMWESSYLARVLDELFQADKLNIAALGNMVPQLHVHHIVRYATDAAWPGPVWGKVQTSFYTTDRLLEITHQLNASLNQHYVAFR